LLPHHVTRFHKRNYSLHHFATTFKAGNNIATTTRDKNDSGVGLN